MVSTKLNLPILIRKNQSLKTKLQESFAFCQKANNEKNIYSTGYKKPIRHGTTDQIFKKNKKKTNRVFNNFAGITTFILKQDKSTSL